MTPQISRRILLSTSAAVSLGFVASACSDPSAGGPAAGGDAAEVDEWPEATADLDGVSLTMWAAQSSNAIAQTVVDGFQDATGATVEIVTIPDPYEHGVQTKVATGDKPDLAFWQPTASQLTVLNAKTNLHPLTDAPFEDAYVGDLASMTGTLDDVRYAALVSSPAAMGIFYNKEVFAANGIDEMPKNWSEMLEVGRQLKSAGVTPFFEMGKDMWATQWWVQVQLADAANAGLWERINTGEDTFTGPDIQGAVDQFMAMIDEGLFNENIKTATFEDQANAIVKGEAAMSAHITALADQIVALTSGEELDAKVGYFPISADSATPTFHPDQANSVVAFTTGDDAKQAAARQFMAYWLSDGYSAFLEDRGLPSVVEGVDSPEAVPALMTELAASLDGAQGSMQAQAIVNPDLAMRLEEMIQGTKTPQQVTQEVQAQFEELAAASGAEGF